MFVKGSCLSKRGKKCEFTRKKKRYKWLRSRNADRTRDIADSFSHALWNDANWWVDKVFHFSSVTRHSYHQMCQSVVFEWFCMILSGFRKILIGNTIVTSFKAAIEHIKCTFANWCLFLVFIQPGTQCYDCFITNIWFSYKQDRFWNSLMAKKIWTRSISKSFT